MPALALGKNTWNRLKFQLLLNAQAQLEEMISNSSLCSERYMRAFCTNICVLTLGFSVGMFEFVRECVHLIMAQRRTLVNATVHSLNMDATLK